MYSLKISNALRVRDPILRGSQLQNVRGSKSSRSAFEVMLSTIFTRQALQRLF